jgi:hypothetical protein
MRKIFRPRKVTVNVPAFTTNSPQTHHKNTTPNTTFSQKTPAKTPIHHAKKKYCKIILKVRSLPLPIGRAYRGKLKQCHQS